MPFTSGFVVILGRASWQQLNVKLQCAHFKTSFYTETGKEKQRQLQEFFKCHVGHIGLFAT